jgi:hypothetical protein
MLDIQTLHNAFYAEVLKWNDERGTLSTLDFNLEKNMLEEEYKEYFNATTTVDKIDAICDLAFVIFGTVAKTNSLNKDKWLTYQVQRAKSFYLITKYAYRFTKISNELYDYLSLATRIDKDKYQGLLHDCFNTVLSANKTKTADKKDNGKIKKPIDFVSPEPTLQKHIEAFIGLYRC